jgi:hypothetical protein
MADADGPSYAAAAAVMALMGAFFWAIRGTTGFGGETGGTLAGFGWALLWCTFSQMLGHAGRRPYNGPWIIVAITAGIAFGGFTGYGVYTAWVRGAFYLDYPNGAREVSAWSGYAMLLVCGFHWGGNAGCLMAWCAPEKRVRGRDWAERVAWGAAGAAAAYAIVRIAPQAFLPYYAEGIYGAPANRTCTRALGSIRNIAPHVGLVLGFLGYELRRGDRRAAALILTMAFGFAIPFAAGGWWHTMHGSSLQLDWWKNWEMTIGLVGGLAFGVAFWRFNRPAAPELRPAGRFARALTRSGLHLWLPSFILLGGAYDGRCELSKEETTLTGYLWLFLLSVCLPLALRMWMRDERREASGDCGASLWMLLALVGMIVCAGCLVSVPAQWQLASTVLLALYTVFIGASILLTIALWRRSRP